jgi:hypothetical protein
MDSFVEKLVKKDVEPFDYLFAILIILGSIIVVFVVSMFIKYLFIVTLVFFGMCYLSYYLISSRSIEYEYIVTNGELDIDIILARQRRKRIFNGKSKEFEILARIDSDKYSSEYQTIKSKINAVSSMRSKNIYFLVSRYKDNKTIVFFEPNEKIIKNLKSYNPRKIF